jgi:hypothetical protein
MDSRGGERITQSRVPISQFWTQVQLVLTAVCNFGCNPLVAPSAFQRTSKNWGTLEGWSRLTDAPPASTVIF